MAEEQQPLLSIVVPMLNELEALHSSDANRFPLHPEVEWIFVDGGSHDGSVETLQQLMAKGISAGRVILLNSAAGRATQMNAGAKAASGAFLLFLHIDTYLPEDFEDWLAELKRRNPVWGFFGLKLDGARPSFRLIERMISWRSRLDCLATGDQAQFVRRQVFAALGGFPNLPIMEDRELSRALRGVAKPWKVADCVLSSSRRWQQHGIWRTVLLMWVMKWRWRMGVSAEVLQRCYRENRLF